MTRDDFMRALDRHGGRIDRWPAELRDAARTLAEADATAANELARLAALEDSLRRATAPAVVDSAFVGRIVGGIAASGPAGPAAAEAVLKPTPRLFALASAMTAAILVVGFVAGATLPAETGDDAVAGLLFGTAYEDVGDSFL